MAVNSSFHVDQEAVRTLPDDLAAREKRERLSAALDHLRDMGLTDFSLAHDD